MSEEYSTNFKLYSYYRSSCSYRVRIALYLKNIPFEYIPVHLVKSGGEQFSNSYENLNPMKQVPTLVETSNNTSETFELTQSIAIIQYLDEKFPSPSLFGKNLKEKAFIIQNCEIINSGIQPLQNLAALKLLSSKYSFSDTDKKEWTAHWIENGFHALEKSIKETADPFSFGNNISAVDLFIVPQVYNAHRFDVDMDQFPTIKKIDANALSLEAFKKAHPAEQLDAI